MAVSTKIIRRRIRSIGNTKKITKAMEMVAGAKMRRAVNAVLASRAYATAAWDTVLHLAGAVERTTHPLLQDRPEPKRAAIIVFSSNRGLCGGYNSHAVSEAMNAHRELKAQGIDDISWIALGKKGAESLARAGFTFTSQFEKPETGANSGHVLTLAQMMINGYLDGTYDRVVVVYTDFVTPLVQKPRTKQLLPLQVISDASLGMADETYTTESTAISPEMVATKNEYIFEPDAATVLDAVLPRLIEVQLYQALLESIASEYSAQMMAMRSATDAASDMLQSLTLLYNQARQAGITREIAEISSGKAALE